MSLCEEYGLRFSEPALFQFNESVLGGEYDVPLTKPRPVILDIGACVGAFTVWALRRWPDATVHAYEPNPVLLDELHANIARASAGLVGGANINMHAVTGDQFPDRVRLYLGAMSTAESSTAGLWHQDKKRSRVVSAISARELPEADFIKIDAEGVELPILQRLHELGRLKSVSAVAYEYHSRQDRNRLENLMLDEGFTFHAGSYLNAIGGTQRWIRP